MLSKNKIIFRKIIGKMKLANAMFFLMLFAPAAWQFIKIPLVILSVTLLIHHYLRHIEYKINSILIIWFSIFLIYGIVWSFIAILKGNPGASDAFRLNIIWVILYGMYVFYFNDKTQFNSIVKTMTWAAIAISIYNFGVVLFALGFMDNINNYLHIDDELTNAIGIHAGYIQLTSNNIGSLTFIAPFLLSLYILKCSPIIGISSLLISVSLILTIITVIFCIR